MEEPCDFLQAYQPSGPSPEPVVVTHLANCGTCRDESFVVEA